jgi:hypothetical protein
MAAGAFDWLREAVCELDSVLGTSGGEARLPLNLLINAVIECAADRLSRAVDSLFSHHSLPVCRSSLWRSLFAAGWRSAGQLRGALPRGTLDLYGWAYRICMATA